jgi:hypothetical protein
MIVCQDEDAIAQDRNSGPAMSGRPEHERHLKRRRADVKTPKGLDKMGFDKLS